ncbi:hypothetical protein BYT27DRAFT_6724230 [Phlegmacium glaucopus]|nr:hypothetical protein BYT27DRAFT_6724230 [Phlegmacium glaucopus]
MQTQDFNPDTRPLPAGWTQHFEPTKQLWCYVQTSVMPPKVSFIHPVDMLPADRGASPYAPINNTQMPQLPVPHQNPSQSVGLTFAQQLYASSMTSSLGPMINSHSVPHLPASQTPSIHFRNLPTPPPSSSPPPGTGTHFPNPPLNEHAMPPNSLGSQSSYPSHQTSSHTMNRRPSPNFNSTPSSAPPFSNPHRANTFQTPVLLSSNSHPQRHRASTYDQGMSQHSVNANPSIAASRPTRHLVTMARPPDQRSPSALSPLFLEPPAATHSALAPSPPPSSILFSQTAGTALMSPLTPPLTSVQSTPVISSVLSVPSGTAYNPQNPFGRVGRVAISIAAGVVTALQSVLLTPSTGVDQLSLQAVVQARPDADYQRIINALMKLHQYQQQQFSLMKLQMQQPPLPPIDYQVLISEVQKLQSLARPVATAQQQQQPPQGQQQQQQQTAAQQYQALIQQQYEQQAAIQQQQQLLQQALAQQQQQQATQYQVLSQQQQQAAAQAQQNQALPNAYAQFPQQPQQQHRPTLQSAAQTYLEVYKQFQHLNPLLGGGGGDTSGGQAQPSFDPASLYSADGGGGGGTNVFDNLSQAFGNSGGNDSGGFTDVLSVSFNQDNSGGIDMSYVSSN